MKKIKPDFVLINIGGGKARNIRIIPKTKFKNKTTILCTGAAISFTKDQAPINSLIDELYLGWFVRLLFNPFVFFKRYIYGLKLIPMVIFNKIKIID